MKVLLDQGLPRSTISHLSLMGIESQHVGDVGLQSASDDEILEFARRQSAVVVTLDADFHGRLAASRQLAPSVVRIRVEGLRAEALANIICNVLTVAEVELEAGAAVSVTTNRIRVRLLPIGR